MDLDQEDCWTRVISGGIAIQEHETSCLEIEEEEDEEGYRQTIRVKSQFEGKEESYLLCTPKKNKMLRMGILAVPSSIPEENKRPISPTPKSRTRGQLREGT